MIELVLTINDKDGSYTEHAGVVLASIFTNTQQSINVHIVHDDTLSEENKARLTQLVEGFHHYIYFYHITVPEDLREVASGVKKIDYWTIASMYRLLFPLIIPADRVIYLDCDILVNMDINELWNVDLGERYLGAVLDQGSNLLEYFVSHGLNAELYFNSGVILFQLDNIRKHQSWYGDMLHYLRSYPTMTMPDQDVLNAVYSSNYLQMDLRYNTFAHDQLDLEGKIIHFAGDSKWWDPNSPALPLYLKFLAMTPWNTAYTPEPVVEPEVIDISPEPPAPEIHHVAELQPVEVHQPEVQPPPPPVVCEPPIVPQVIAPAPESVPVKRHRRKSRRLMRLRLRLKLRLRRKKLIRAKFRSKMRARLIKGHLAKKKKARRTAARKLRTVRKTRSHVTKTARKRGTSSAMKRRIKRAS